MTHRSSNPNPNRPRLLWLVLLICGTLLSPAIAQDGDLSPELQDRLDRQRDQLINQGMEADEVDRIMEARRQAMLRVQAQRQGQVQRQPGEDRAPDRVAIEADIRENPESDGEIIRFTSFAEGVNLRQLVEYTADVLELNVSIDQTLTGSVGFNSGFSIRRDELLPLVNALLEQQGYMLTQERVGFIAVRRVQDVPVSIPGVEGFATTRVIRCPNLKPSAVAQTLQQQFAQPGNQQAGLRLSALDDLGLLMVTDTPGRLSVIEGLVNELVREQADLQFLRFELIHVAAPAARNRVIELVGGEAQVTAQSALQRIQRAERQAAGGITSGEGVENFADRLRIDPQGNALIFRGRPDEAELVREALAVVDVPSTLAPKRYFTGSATADIARFAQLQGLGELTTVSSDGSSNQQFTVGAVPNRTASVNQQLAGLNQAPAAAGGPILVVDPSRGQIVYYGTRAQQDALQRVVDQFDPEAEQIVIREYKLEHADAEETAELLRELILMEDQTASGSLLPGGQRGAQRNVQQPQSFVNPNAAGGDEAGFTGRADEVLIAADIANNQLLVRAPIQQQDELRKIVQKIDVRRPQVYIDVKIVSISDSDEFRLAVETQLINAGGAGGVGQTNFGLTSAGDAITDLRDVATGLSGLTSALILSDQLPFVINAVQTVTDARILSNPTLLVDDNEEAELINVRQEPTTQQSQGDNTTITSFQGFEDAGTTLLVTPRISAGGYLRLNYEITLSNFVGTGTSDGIPPPREERTIRADSVTIPGDATIVVGGINVRDVRSTVVKVPLLGDIPLLGYLFSDTREDMSDSVLYVFITPRILNDRSFGGHRLISRGPRKVAELAPDIPPMKPELVPMADAQPARTDPTGLDIDAGSGGDE